jgi:hypothetical protein
VAIASHLRYSIKFLLYFINVVLVVLFVWPFASNLLDEQDGRRWLDFLRGSLPGVGGTHKRTLVHLGRELRAARFPYQVQVGASIFGSRQIVSNAPR